jgi:hypothetical protein
MSDWSLLEHELDAWAALGRRATLWWRDDDACSDTPALGKLLDIAGAEAVPVAIAAIPAGVEGSLVDAVTGCAHATIVQHGYAHRNHAAAGERAAELGAERTPRERLDELGRGRERLAALFGARFVPVLVPPWNRIAEDIVADLPAAGLSGVSCFGPRASFAVASGIAQVNTHVDPIAWRRGRVFAGVESAIGRLVAHLRARRTAQVDAAEPSGLLTHHLAFGDDAFDFVRDLVRRTTAHAAAAWIDVRCAFDEAAALGAMRSESATCARSA